MIHTSVLDGVVSAEEIGEVFCLDLERKYENQHPIVSVKIHRKIVESWEFKERRRNLVR